LPIGLVIDRVKFVGNTADGVITRAVKERLHGSARDFDRLADAAQSAARLQTRLPGSSGHAKVVNRSWRRSGLP
jgi:hypothetical protein